ncbi:MAG: hypothetical protein LAT84_10155 [Balneolia bacterium]|nr:hypothetical protein [Balneolia bacterium]
MPVQIVMLILVAIGLVIYIYRLGVISQYYRKNGQLPEGRHSVSNLVFAAMAFVLIVFIWNNLSWAWYMLPLFGAALSIKLWIDFYYTPAALYISGRHAEPAG